MKKNTLSQYPDPKVQIEMPKYGRVISMHNGCTFEQKVNGYDLNFNKARPFVILASGRK